MASSNSKVVVTLVSMGWDADEDGNKRFVGTIVFTEPPPWPVNVVWNAVPMEIQPQEASDAPSP